MGEKDEHALLLGEIKGQLGMVIDGQRETNDKIGNIDTRLRHVETKAATTGAISGGIMAVGMAILIEKIKAVTGLHG